MYQKPYSILNLSKRQGAGVEELGSAVDLGIGFFGTGLIKGETKSLEFRV